MDAKIQALFADHLDTVSRRTARALEATGFDGLILSSGSPPLQFADDQPYPYKAYPGFRRWVPEAAPGCLLAFQPGQRPRLVFHQPADYWHLPPRAPHGPWTAGFDIRIVRSAAEARAAAGPGRGQRWALLGEPQADWEGLGEANPAALVAALDHDRAAKTPYEIACLTEASTLAARAHRAAERAWRGGGSEYEVHLEYCRAAGVREQDLPYNNIIACDRHAAVLHYQHLDLQAPSTPLSLLVDAGAPYAGYGSDVTRTHAASEGAFADLVAAMDTLQQRLAGMVVPGRDYREIHLEAHRLIAGVLVEAGLVRATCEEAVERGVTRVFFPHGIGHLLGLQVHDVGGLMADESGAERPRPAGHPFLRLTRDLAAGFVVTIEPGIYFIEPLLAAAARDDRRALIDWDCVQSLAPCGGIRVEDNVVALPAGPRNLTREAFSALS